jgi:hypothetical protein
MAAAARLEASKDVLQRLPLRSRKSVFAGRGGAPLLTSSEETKKLLDFVQFLGARSRL